MTVGTNIHSLYIEHNHVQFSDVSVQFYTFKENYLYSSVEKFMILCEILQANKSIRVTQLTFESLFIFLRSKVVRQTVILFHTLQLTRNLGIYFHFPNDTSIEPSASDFFSKVNGLEVWRK